MGNANSTTRDYTTHSMSGTPEYRAFHGMHDRCRRSKNASYDRYGGRGITVCVEWQSFEAFYLDMGPRPSANHSLERVNNELGYSKSNCCWATPAEQSRNKRTSHLITFNGTTQCVTDWANQFGIPPSTLMRRLKRGWSIEEALTTAAIPLRNITFNGITMSLSQWARQLNMSHTALSSRFRRGWTVEEALATTPGTPRTQDELITCNSQTMSLTDWARHLGMCRKTLQNRLDHGWSIEKTLTRPPSQQGRKDNRVLTFVGKTLTVAAWAKETGLKVATIKKRLKNKWSVERALTEPVKGKS